MTLDQILTEIKERADKATEGPWKFYPMSYNKHPGYTSCDRLESKDKIIGMMEAFCGPTCLGKCDLTFIAHARTDVPRLVEALEVSRELIVELQSQWNEKEPIAFGMAMRAEQRITNILTGEHDES